MNLLNLFEGTQTTGFENLRALLQAVQHSSDATLTLGGEPITLTYPEARWMVGKYKAFLKAGQQADFINDLGDPVRFDGHMKQLRKLIDKQKTMKGSVIGQRGIPGETTTPFMAREEAPPVAAGAAPEGPGQSPKAQGTRNYGVIAKTQDTNEPVYIEFPQDGGARYVIGSARDKKWFVLQFHKYTKAGLQEKFLIDMGTHRGFERLLDRFADEHSAGAQQQQGGAKNPRQQGKDLAESVQKKRVKISEDDRASDTPARTRRILDKLRIAQPQAKSDLEALAYSFQDAEKKDRTDIERLEREADSIEKNVKQDLETSIGNLKRQRERSLGLVNKIQANDQEQTSAINRLLKIDRDQQQAIDDLKRAAGGKPSRVAPPADVAPAVGGVSADGKKKTTRRPAPKKVSPLPAVPIGSTDIETSEPELDLPPVDQAPQPKPTTNVIPFKQPELPGLPAARPERLGSRRVAERIGIRGLGERRAPKPTNQSLWKKAVMEAAGKFDAMNPLKSSWAAKWYKAHGGTWKK